MRQAKAIHVVEKGIEINNLRPRSDIGEGIWETAYWIVGDKTAASLIGGKVYVHRGQNVPSHAGGKIIEDLPRARHCREKACDPIYDSR